MYSDSDTESEHESHTGCNDGAFGSPRRPRSALSTSTGEDITDCNEFLRDQDALSAIEQIKSVDVCTICQVSFYPSTGLKTIP
jgi:copper oxidase (laccase) domain-containing protein